MKKNKFLVILVVIILMISFFFIYFFFNNENQEIFIFKKNLINLNVDEIIEIPLYLSNDKLYSKVQFSNYDSEIIEIVEGRYIKGKKSGSTVIFATLNNKSINLFVKVISNNSNNNDNSNNNSSNPNNNSNNVSNENVVTGIPMINYEFSKTENVNEKKVLKVLIVDIDPILTKGQIKGKNCKGITASECLMQDKQQVINELISDIEFSSHGIIDIEIVKTDRINEFSTHKNQITLLNGTKSYKFDEDTWLDIMKKGWYTSLSDNRLNQIGAYSFDYEYLFNKLDIINRKNNNEFDEVWLVNVEPTKAFESIMVGKSAYWINGRPITKNCDNFRIINVSISRPDANLECNGHAAEDILNMVFDTNLSYKENNLAINSSNYNNLNLWQRFTLVEHHNIIKNTGLSGVGDVHFSPNSIKDYDWKNYNNGVTSKWREWLNYPNLTSNPSTEVFNPTVYMNASASGTKSAARLHHRWWFSLMPHVTGYTNDGYSNNWWDYLYLSDFVTSVAAETKNYTYNIGDRIDNIKIKLNYKSLKSETITINNYQNNMIFSNQNLFSIDGNGKIVAASSGSSTLKYYRDGKFETININIL